MKRLTAMAACSLALLGAPQAEASIITYNLLLTGQQAGTPSTASGSASVTVDDILNTVAVSLSYAGLTGGPASAAHIHCCVPVGSNGPVVIPFVGFPGATSGTYSNTFTGVSPTNIAGIKGGLAYINIHNTQFPGGEIRGNINVPEPTSLSLVGLATLLSLGVLRRRSV